MALRETERFLDVSIQEKCSERNQRTVSQRSDLSRLRIHEHRDHIGSIRQLRGAAPDHSVAVNLLMPFLRRSHVDVCIESRIDVAVIAFGMDWALQRRLTEHDVSGRAHRGDTLPADR